MKDFFNTVIPIGETITKKVKNKFYLRFRDDPKIKKLIHPITKRYEDKIKDALVWASDMQETVNYILDTLTRLININNLKDNADKNLIFEQIIIFMNYLCLELRSKFLFNTLTNNDLREFNDQTIWDNINNLSQNWWDSSRSWFYCIHYALLFKKIFDELEKRTNLWISNYLFLERSSWLNHAWLVVTFNWKNYLVDSSFFNKKFMQPINDMWKYYNRMESLENCWIKDIKSDSIQKVKNDYIEHDYDYYKIMLKSSDDLLRILDSIPRKIWSISRMYNILGNTLWINFRISNRWIEILGAFTYYFDHIISKEELNNISDDVIMDLFVDSIWYKIDKSNNRKIHVYDFEKKYIRSVLSYFSDKINYSNLRKVLSNT